ncbi:hypothetical protein [Leisingera caerulea]|uniref:hypothetical protein n=1 Tax=Leisingera caerulea TaxID=506591 RepID=UPI0021A31949|nr:hypothetical protein [Leisingera caerulea]UWQ85009.1 hypothetical protein K3726_07340 [Leisingera caerulea]
MTETNKIAYTPLTLNNIQEYPKHSKMVALANSLLNELEAIVDEEPYCDFIGGREEIIEEFFLSILDEIGEKFSTPKDEKADHDTTLKSINIDHLSDLDILNERKKLENTIETYKALMEEFQSTLKNSQSEEGATNEKVSAEDTSGKRITPWGFINEFRYKKASAVWTKLYGIEEKLDQILAAKKDSTDSTISFLHRHAADLIEIEDQFVQCATQSGLTVEICMTDWEGAGRSIEDIEASRDTTIFLDQHLFNGYRWRLGFEKVIADCIKTLNVERLEELENVMTSLPKSLSFHNLDGFTELRQTILKLKSDLRDGLRNGLSIKTAKELGKSQNLERFGIVMKTWLDQMANEGLVAKGRNNGRVAYYLSENETFLKDR